MRQHRIGVIGAGAWGTAVAKLLADGGHRVHMWVYEEEVARTINTEHRDHLYLMSVELPKSEDAVRRKEDSDGT